MSMTWNPTTRADYDGLKGFDVYSSDSEKVGTIKEVFHPQDEMPTARSRHYFHVEPGTFKKLFSDADEVYVSERLITTVDPNEDTVILEVPKEQLKDQDWSRPPELDRFRRS